MERVVKSVGYLKGFLNSGNKRSAGVKKNILASFFIKGTSIGISLLLVPLTINYVNPSQYGIWITLSSIVAWFSFFDIGFGNGFRNKFAIARANQDTQLAKTYVSTVYAFITLIFVGVWLLFFIANQFIDWNRFLNLRKNRVDELSLIVLITFTFFCLQFVLRLISTVVTADQQPAKASLLDTLGQVVSLILIFAITRYSEGSLLILSIGLGSAPVLVLIGANLYFFSTTYKAVRPSFSFVKLDYAKDIMNLGVKFFVIQIAGIIQYETTNVLIARFFGTYEVTAYNIAYKYFNILNMAFAIFLIPFWSSVTDAYAKHDLAWIRNSVKRYLTVWSGLLVLGLGMLMISGLVYDLWLGKGKVIVSFDISFWSMAFLLLSMFANIFVYVINGIGAVKLQFLMCFLSPLLFLASAYILVKQFHFGVSAILVSSIISNVNGFILAPIQYRNIMAGKKGIWIK